MELVSRQFDSQCPKELKDVLDLVESLSKGLVRDAKDGLELTEIIANLTANITGVSSAVDGASQIGDGISEHKVVTLDYCAKWGADLGKSIYLLLEANKASEGEAQA